MRKQAKLGLETVDNWNSVMSDALPKIFKQYDLEYNNVLWWFDVHRNTEHPHVHAGLYRKTSDKIQRKKYQKQNWRMLKGLIYTCIAAKTEAC